MHNAFTTLLPDALISISDAAIADNHSPRRLGAFSGAMQYCAETLHGQDPPYRRIRLHIAHEVDGTSRADRNKAVSAQAKAHEQGRFLGWRLDRDASRTLLRQGEWARYRDD